MKIIFTLFLVSSALTAFSQHDHDTDHGASHAQHIQESRKKTVYIHDLPRPKLMEGIGTSNLKIQTKSDSCQRFFSQGIALLHCYWDFEAYRSFKEAARLDSTAIMPWWGLLTTTAFMKDEAFKMDKELSLKKLKALVKSASDHEKLYATGILLADSLKENGDKEYQKKIETIIHKYPDDIDAQLFLANNNMAGYNFEQAPNEGQIYSEYVIKNLLQKYPDNAAANHYWIHLMESCCPEKALESANKLTRLAYSSGHMVHMPGHIYNRLGDYKNAYDSFTASVKVDSAYMKQNGIQEVDTWNYIHNIHYLLANCAQDGRYSKALYYAEKLNHMTTDKARKKVYDGSFFGQGIIAPARMELCFGYYEKAANRLKAISDPDSIYGEKNMAYKEALTFFALGMQAIENKKLTEAQKFADALDSYLWRNTTYEKPDKSISKFALKHLVVASLELQGSLKGLENKYDAAVVLLEDAVKKEEDLGYSEPPYYPRPVKLSLANVYAKAGKYDKAIATLEDLLKKHPNGAPALYGLYKVYKQKGEAAKAKEFAERLKQTTLYGDKGLYPL